jgi:hypothetical protein
MSGDEVGSPRVLKRTPRVGDRNAKHQLAIEERYSFKPSKREVIIEPEVVEVL